MKKVTCHAILYVMLLMVSGCTSSSDQKNPPAQGSAGKIFLYGETHGNTKILDRELEIWQTYYKDQNMRHFFLELPYYTAEFMNIWMHSESNDILDALYNDWQGTDSHNPDVREFYIKIKELCPETVFHGTDVGHQYGSTGKRFLEYLQNNNLSDSGQYLLTIENIEQGKKFYGKNDYAYRENMMTKNFIREFDKLDGKGIMGIYGTAHTRFLMMDISGSVPCMANQLKEYYDQIYSEDLTRILQDIDPLRIETADVGGKEYKALYFGKQDMTGNRDFVSREVWRLENAYADFKDSRITGDVLPYDNYPMLISDGQVFKLRYTMTDGSVKVQYYRSDGYIWNGRVSTQEFIVE